MLNSIHVTAFYVLEKNKIGTHVKYTRPRAFGGAFQISVACCFT